MKKIDISKTLSKTKWLVILLVTIVLIIFGRTVDPMSLTSAAIVIGIGIDYSEGEFTISTQSVLPTNSSAAQSASATNYDLYTEKGRTITEAVDRISQRMGLKVSLSHCNVLVLSPAALKLNHILLIDPLISTLTMPEQTVVVSSATPPKELLAKRVSTTISAPFYLQQLLLKNSGSDGILRITVKDFMAKTTSRSGGAVIPYIETEKLEDQPLTPEGEGKDNVKLKMNKLLAFDQKDSFVLDEEVSRAVTLFMSSEAKGSLDVLTPEGFAFEFNVSDVSSDKKTEDRKVEAKIKITANFSEAQYVDAKEPVNGNDEMTKKAAKTLTDKLSAALEEADRLAKENNIDFLGLQNLVYRKIGYTLERDCLGTIEFKPKFEMDVKENY